ncbi:MAG: Lsr2 family DNA-binding protein [Actinomycetales bacterium]
MSRDVRKSIDRIFILRVSGKGDQKGSANQLHVLEQYRRFTDVVSFLDTFDVEMMSASSRAGEVLRRTWQREHGLKVLYREGSQYFLGVSVVIGRSRFIVYAESAAKMDEASGNAFTRHVCAAIADPEFNGLGDREFMAARDAGAYDRTEHPSLVYAFDPTRFCRSTSSATQLYDAAERDLVAFEAQDLHIDPAQGSHMRMMWTFIAFGSEVEATVGKLRRFVGRLNKARSGCFPYPAGMAPLGSRRVAVADALETYQLDVDEDHVTSVARLLELGLDRSNTYSQILDVLGKQCGVTSGDMKTPGMPVHELDPAAAKRFFVRRKLEAYRDGELELVFTGVMENQLRPGSGHILTRRWEGLNAAGEPDRLGAVSYRIRMPKPTVAGPDGSPRQGWIAGLSDEEERAAWDRLIALRGVDDSGRRPVEELDQELLDTLSPDDLAQIQQDAAASRRTARGGRTPDRAVTVVFTPSGEEGSRVFLRARGTRSRLDGRGGLQWELRHETGHAGPGGGLSRRPGATALDTGFAERDLTAALATLITEAVRVLTDSGHAVGPHQIVLSPALAEQAATASPAEARAAAERELTEHIAAARQFAGGCDRNVAALLADGIPENHPRVLDAKTTAENAWAAWQQAVDDLDKLQQLPVPAPAPVELPQLDVTDPRDLVVGLRGVYATGKVPPGFAQALRHTIPVPPQFAPLRDSLQWEIRGDVTLTTTTGETVTVADVRTTVTTIHGRSGSRTASDRAAEFAARRMRDGQLLEEIADASGMERASVSRLLIAHLRGTGAFPDDARLAQAVDCPIPDTTAILWGHATGQAVARTDRFAQHVLTVFTQAADEHAATRTGRGTVWAYDLDVDRRRDQLTILSHALNPAAGIRADGLLAALDRNDVKPRRVLDASTNTVKVNAVYPPVLRRVPAPGYPAGWYGRNAAAVSAEHKWLSFTLCPHADCPETYATVLVPAVEVLALGAMMLCRRCRRAATPTDHPLHATAAGIRFPQAYITWFDAQPHRTGNISACARPGCSSDIGFGAGNTWQWDDEPSPVWHDDDCRAGQTTGIHTRCRYLHCTLDEGAGPGSIRQEGRGRRTWHTRDCENAERRRVTAAKVEYVICRLEGCTLDEGGGPGSIRRNGKHRTVHNETCRQAVKNGTDATVIRRWARARGHHVPDVGRLPQSILTAYRAAQAET